MPNPEPEIEDAGLALDDPAQDLPLDDTSDTDAPDDDADFEAMVALLEDQGQGPSTDKEAGILEEGGFKRFPVLAPRWVREGDDTYGQSPCSNALPFVRRQWR